MESSELAALAKQVKTLRQYVVLAWVLVVGLACFLYWSMSNQVELAEWMTLRDKELEIVHQRLKKIEAKKP